MRVSTTDIVACTLEDDFDSTERTVKFPPRNMPLTVDPVGHDTLGEVR